MHLHEESEELQTLMDEIQKSDVVMLRNTFQEKSDHTTRTCTPKNGNVSCASEVLSAENVATYYLQGDKFLAKIMPYMGTAEDVSDSIATSVLTGMASLILSSASDGSVLAKGRRNIVNEYLGKLTERDGALESQEERGEEKEEQHLKPWSLLKRPAAGEG